MESNFTKFQRNIRDTNRFSEGLDFIAKTKTIGKLPYGWSLNLPEHLSIKDFQDLILTVHHCYMNLLMNTPAFKVIENHMGVGMNKAQLMQNAPGRT